MTAGVLEVEETIEHLEPGDDITCDAVNCESRASLWLICRACRARSAVCDLCAVQLDLVFLLLGGAVCLACGRHGRTLRTVCECVPIGGGS